MQLTLSIENLYQSKLKLIIRQYTTSCKLTNTKYLQLTTALDQEVAISQLKTQIENLEKTKMIEEDTGRLAEMRLEKLLQEREEYTIDKDESLMLINTLESDLKILVNKKDALVKEQSD